MYLTFVVLVLCRASFRLSSHKVGSVGEASEFFLHRLRQDTLHWRQDRRDTREFGVEVAGVGFVLDGGHESICASQSGVLIIDFSAKVNLRCRDFLFVDVHPIDSFEECMAHDFLRVCRSTSQSQLRLACEELLKYRDRVARHVNRVERFIGQDGIVDLVLVLAAERRLLE